MCKIKNEAAIASKISILILAFGFLMAFGVSPAHAQAISVGPSPASTPILSPYLDLLRRDGGVLPNYQQFVQPRIQARETLQRQQRAIDRQSQSVRAVNRRVSSIRNAADLTTGVRTGYLRYSTFYPGLEQR